MRLFVLVLLTLLSLLLFPSLASSQEEGVIVDPDSPAGKEYAIPLERARNEASGIDPGDRGGPRRAGVSDAAPPFGIGITARRASEDGQADGDHGGSGRKQSSTGADSHIDASPTATVAGGATGPSATAWTAGVVLMILAGAGLLVLLLRFTRRGSE